MLRMPKLLSLPGKFPPKSQSADKMNFAANLQTVSSANFVDVVFSQKTLQIWTEEISIECVERTAAYIKDTLLEGLERRGFNP